MKKILFHRAVVCALVSFSMLSSQAQVAGSPELKAAAPNQLKASKSSSKLSTALKNVYDNHAPASGKAELKAQSVLPDNKFDQLIQIKGDRVLVDVTVKDNAKGREELEKLGLKVTAVFGRVISGTIPISALPKIESAANVKFARPSLRMVHQSTVVNTGGYMHPNTIVPVISQGDTAQRSYLARKKYHVNGKGVKVGILSDSYNNLGTAETGVEHDELPGINNPFNFKTPVQVLEDIDSGGTDEGRGMAEIVHDVAPGSPLAFHTAFKGEADFAQGILDLAAAGCKVIVDDAFYFDEPFFQDGIVAQAVDAVKQKGVTYFSSAGNHSVRSYENAYHPCSYAPLGANFGTAHNFSAPGAAPRYFQPIYIPTNGTLIISFQWDQPFFSAGGAGSQSDLDIYLLDTQGNIVAGSASDNIMSGDPVEIFGYSNHTASNTFYIAILKYAGPDPTRLKYINFGDGAFYLTNPPIPGILAPTLVGHPKAEGAIATAAAFYFYTPAYGVDTPRVEAFSSVGGVANYFDTKGNRIPPVIRRKPEITAPDGGNTSFFPPSSLFGNQDIPQDSDTLPNFFGTSAAAPHAAGVAALMIEAQRLNTLTPDQIKGVLSANTVDMDNIYTPGFDVGFDFDTGTGLIKADAAVGEVVFPNLYVKDLKLVALCSDNPDSTRRWKIINPNPFEVEVHWIVAGFQQYGKIIVQPGDTTLTTTTAYYWNKAVPNVVIIDWQDNFRLPHFAVVNSSLAQCGRYVISANHEPATGVADAETIESLNKAEVYPNPSSSNFRLYLSLAGQQNTDIELYSADGKSLLRQTTQSNGVIDIDASRYQPGSYILKVKQGSFTKTFKLIRQ